MTESLKIDFAHVSFSFGSLKVLDDVSLNLPPGQTAAVIGKSGSGKSTLIKLVNGLIRPQLGVVKVNERDMDYSTIYALRRKIGYVMQQAGLFPHMNVRENVALVARLEGWNEKRIRARIDDLLDLVNLNIPGLLEKRPSMLSGGQRQRVAIARALMLDPPLLLMDEPFSALDPLTRFELQNEFLKIKKEIHKTILIVTHDFAEGCRLADRILLIDEGKIVQDSSPRDFVTHPQNELARSFVNSIPEIPR